MWQISLQWWELAIRGGVLYAFVLLLLRIGRKHAIAPMGAAEFVAMLPAAKAVQNPMNGRLPHLHFHIGGKDGFKMMR